MILPILPIFQGSTVGPAGAPVVTNPAGASRVWGVKSLTLRLLETGGQQHAHTREIG